MALIINRLINKRHSSIKLYTVAFFCQHPRDYEAIRRYSHRSITFCVDAGQEEMYLLLVAFWIVLTTGSGESVILHRLFCILLY